MQAARIYKWKKKKKKTNQIVARVNAMKRINV